MVMVLMDLPRDQTMSSSSPSQPQPPPPPPPQPPISLAEQIPRPDTGSSSSPSPFQTQTSTETDEHDDEHSKASNQTVVTMHQASHQQLGSIQAQQKLPELRPSSSPIGGHGELKQQQQQQQRMIVSGGSSFGDEDDEGRLVMNVDSEEEISSRVVGTSLKLDQAELEARLKQTRFGYQQGGKPTDVESSLVAQMRDIVEGKNQRNIAPVLAKATDACQEEDKENIATMAPSGSLEARCPQPKSSNDSLSNNQNNDNGQSRVPIDNAGQKRARHVSRHQCRHHHHDHHPHHHHHHHHHQHHQSISGGSLPGQMEAGTSSETAAPKLTGHTHHGHSHHHHRHNHGHHHHHQHHHHHLARQRHSNAGHHHHHAAGHNHHGHHHHNNHRQNQQDGEPGKRGSSVQRLSLALIEAGSAGTGNGTRVEAADGCTNDSSMSSMSSLANRQLRTVQTETTVATTNNPNQSKSSESAVSGEHSTSVAAAANDSDQIVPSKEAPAVGAGHHSRSHHHHHHHHGNSNHHHHYHHQHCQHRSNKRRLVVDTRDGGEKQSEGTQEGISALANDTRREPLKDATIEQTTDIKSDQAPQHLGHNHHHHHHHHRNHCHCAHRHGIQGENQQSGDGDQSSTQSKAHLHHHHNYCTHRHHRYHHHHHHHHQPGRQQQSRSSQRSISQTNITTNDSGEQPEGTNAADEIATERRNSIRAEVDEVVKMETSPPPQLVGPTLGEAHQTSDEQASPSVVADMAIKSVAEIVDNKEVIRTEATKDGTLNEGSNFMDSKNQESLRSGCDEGNDQQQRQRIDGANKLTRQMSSQSSRRSQNTGGALPPAGSPGRRQSEHLRECAERTLQPAAETTAINQRESESTRQAVETANGLLADRRCRLCWCCCCPCSALSTRDASSRPADKPKAVGALAASNSPVSSNYPSLPNVPLDEIRSWGESFDKLMRCSDGRKVFQDFLRCEYSEENILFWSACEELKKERDSKSVAAKARDIYEDYISILSSKEVSLDSRVRDVINHNIKRPTSNIFDEAQLQIYTLMHRDSYPRFINSIMYKKLAQVPMSNSRKSSS